MAFSFYGGKEGVSFTIKARFDSIDAMLTEFAKGGAYNIVGYGEFVIVDTPNKSDYTNGALFKRGFDYDTPKYSHKLSVDDIGQMTVYDKDTEPPYPDDKIAEINDGRLYWNDYYSVINKVATKVADGTFNYDAFDNAVINFLSNLGCGAVYIGRICGPEGGSIPITLEQWSDTIPEGSQTSILENVERPSGKVDSRTKIRYCNIVDSETGNITQACMAFSLPYDVFEIQAESASAYGPTVINASVLPVTGIKDVYYKTPNNEYYLYENNTWIERQPWTASAVSIGGQVEWNYTGLIREKQESEDNPYYYSYDVKIPKGIHGNEITDIGVDPDTKEWYYKYKDYNTKEEGEEHTKSITDVFYKVIDSIEGEADQLNLTTLARNTAYTTGIYVKVPNNNNILLLCTSTINDGKTAVNSSSLPDFTNIDLGTEFQDGNVFWLVTRANVVPIKQLRVNYTYGQDDVFDNIRLLNSLELDDDGKLYARYSDTLNNRDCIGNANAIQAMKMLGDNFLVLYSSPANRARIPQSQRYVTNWTAAEGGDGQSYVWQNFGPLPSALHIAGNYATLSDLETAYPYGFGKDTSGNPDPNTEGWMGWLVSVGNNSTSYQLYAYDYIDTTKGWYKVQDLSSAAVNPLWVNVVAKPDSTNPDEPENDLGDTLNENGLWFVITE